jgi:hypothetical protein
MKIVKLHRRHRLHDAGFSWAIQWAGACDHSTRVYDRLYELYGAPRYVNLQLGPANHNQYWGRWRAARRDGRQKFWIGFRSEADITAILLQVPA